MNTGIHGRVAVRAIALFIALGAAVSPGYADGYEVPPPSERARAMPYARTTSAITVQPQIPAGVTYYSPQSTDPSIINPQVFVVPGGTWLYSTPSTAATALAFLPEGTQVTILGFHDGFYLVRYGALTGYVPITALRIIYPTQTATPSEFGYWTQWGWFWRWR